MSLSVDAIRREIGERRDLLVRLQRSIDANREAVERAERDLAQAKAALEAHQAKAAHEQRSIEALQAAVAVLTERMPEPVPEPVAPEPARPAPTPAPEPAPRPRPTGRQVRRARHAGRLDPLHVTTKNVDASSRVGQKRGPQRSVYDRAAELDMEALTEAQLERADLLFMLIEEQPGRQIELAVRLAMLMECGETTATAMVSVLLPLLVRQNRVVSEDELGGDGTPSRGMVWKVAPPQAASANLGVDDDNYAGTTTRWPTESTAPAKGTHIKVESTPFEQGKR